jgi:hypothetical protein
MSFESALSDLLLLLSMKALGANNYQSFNTYYLLNTKPADIDSKFGLYLRELIQKKKANPEFAVPYIKGQAKLPRSRKTSVWEYKQIPSIYMPAHAKVSEDHSKYFFKTPQEMSRHEIANLEQMLREIDEPDEFIPDEVMWASEEFQDLKKQMLALCEQDVPGGAFLGAGQKN